MNTELLHVWNTACEHGMPLHAVLLVVHTDRQQLDVVTTNGLGTSYLVSTSRHGLLAEEGSGGTPPGLHCVTERYGATLPLGTVFESRQPTGAVLDPPDWMGTREEDVILTRILCLTGMEPGINRGGDRDSHARFIYLHGTNQEQRIGTPSSGGCVRMRNEDIARLFDQVAGRDVWCLIR